MDSKGIYDASTRNLSSLHGLRDSRAGYELTLAVIQAQKAGTLFRWVCGLAQLADTLTKYNDRKALLQFFAQKQFWKLVHDETFTAGRKVHKKALERKLREDQDFFVAAVKEHGREKRLAMDRRRYKKMYSTIHLLRPVKCTKRSVSVWDASMTDMS